MSENINKLKCSIDDESKFTIEYIHKDGTKVSLDSKIYEIHIHIFHTHAHNVLEKELKHDPDNLKEIRMYAK